MPIIKLETAVNAPLERVFDLARCIDVHRETMTRHKERAVAGVCKGLINMGEQVTWEAVHFGVRQTLTSKITVYDRPHHFRDSMVEGAFARFDHDHFFASSGTLTLMSDVFDYAELFGVLGRIADRLFLDNYMQRILAERNRVIKQIAESDEWEKFLVYEPELKD